MPRRRSSVADPVLKRGMFQMKALLEELPKTQSFERKKKEAEKEKKKDHELREVLLELLKTEGNYLADLQFTTKEFAAPLHALLKQEQYFDIFANLEQLEQLHMRLETDLEPARAAIREHDGKHHADQLQLASLVATAFKPFIPLLMLYATYCGKFTDAPAKLQETVKHSKKVQAMVLRAQTEFNTALEALLFRPVQRMCVYPLLFKQALKALDEDTAEHKAFEECFEAVSKTIQMVNENVRMQEAEHHTQHLLCVQIRNASELLAPGRHLISEATVRFQRVDGTLLAFGNLLHRKRTCHVLLFTDMLLVCKPQGGGFFTRVATLPLDEIDVATNAGEDVQWAAEDEDGDGDGGAPATLSKRASSEEEIILAAREDDSRTAAEREATARRVKRQWIRATRWVVAEEKKKEVLVRRLSAGSGGSFYSAGTGPGSLGGIAEEESEGGGSSTAVGVRRPTATNGPPPPSDEYMSVPRATWNNLITIVQGQMSGDPAPWKEDDNIWGHGTEREALTIVHHGPGGGVYKAWAASEAEGRDLVRRVNEQQEKLRKNEDLLHQRQTHAEEQAKAGRSLWKKRVPKKRAPPPPSLPPTLPAISE